MKPQAPPRPSRHLTLVSAPMPPLSFRVIRAPLRAGEISGDTSTTWLNRHHRFRRIHSYLAAKAGEKALPARRDIDPLDIPELLPYLMMVDVDHESSPLRFRFRLIGTEFVDVIGRELTGGWIDEVLKPEYRPPAEAMCDTVVQERRPSLWIIHNPVGRENLVFECAMFPLSSDGRTIDLLLGVHARMGDFT